MSTFVLIHGAGDSGWYWHLVEAELRAHGHDVVAPDLPAGDESTDLNDYARAVADAVGDRTDLVVVGQSFGAFTAPLVAHRLAADVLILIAGMVPTPGETPGDWWANAGYRQAVQEQAARDGGLTGNDDPYVAFYHDVPRPLATEAMGRERAHPSEASMAKPWPLDAWPDIPTKFVLCTEDRFFPPDLFRRVVAERLHIVPDEIAAGHCVALSRPTELATMLRRYAARESGLRSALWLPLFDELADPTVVADLAAEAEHAGWHGFFVWDHVHWHAPVRQVADSWITLAAVAAATERLRLGPMVTPLPRRRPAKVAREAATLDLLSGGRLTLGVGIGSDRFGGELSKFGEQIDDRLRGQMLDEALEILAAAWSGEPVHHHGAHYTVDDVRFLPRPVQRPGVPVWAAAFPGNLKPLRRAARCDGFFPVNLQHPDQLAEAMAVVTDPDRPAYDVAVALPPGADPAPYARAGATWWLA
jgi:hypothetical protein